MPIDAGRAKELFIAVLEMPAAQRAAYLDTACAGDTALRQRVEAMLQTHEHSGELLSRAAAEMLADDATEGDATAAFMPRPHISGTQVDGQGVSGDSLAFLAPPQQSDSLGRLGHYEILEVIGKGGFGIVLKGFDERLRRVVAIKVLAPAYAAHGAARKRFIREAQSFAAVKNEHVVSIHDVQENADPPYLVMEMIDGISLQDKIDKHGALGLKEILRIGMQTAEGLAAAHRQGLVHRDIKPANILLENGVERVKITDFGLARSVDDATVTQSGTVAGTPMYMSPEQAEGLTIDHRSDLFSLGTVLYAMCTGHPPFRASGTHAVLKRVIDAAPRPIRETNADIPEWLCDIITKLHAKKPDDRYQSAKEVAEVLGQRLADVQAGRTIVEKSHIGERVEAQPALRNPPSVLPTTLAGMVLGVVFGLLTGLTEPEKFWVWGERTPLWLGVIYSAGMGAAVGILAGFLRIVLFARIAWEVRNAGRESAPAPTVPHGSGAWRIAALAIGVVGFFFIVSALMLFNLPAHRVSPPGVQWLLATVGLAAFIVSVFLAFPPSWWRRGVLVVLFLGVGVTTSALLTTLVNGLLVGNSAFAQIDISSSNVEVVLKTVEETGKSRLYPLKVGNDSSVPEGSFRAEIHVPHDRKIDAVWMVENGMKRRLTGDDADGWALELTKGQRVAFIVETAPLSSEPGWVQLFNGKDLDGWLAYAAKADAQISATKAWEVKNNLIHGKAAGEYSYLRTKKAYQDFILKLEYRCPPGSPRGRAGITLLGAGPDKIWPRSFQLDLAGLNGFNSVDLTSMDFERFTPPSAGVGGKDWWRLEIVARGGTIEFFFQGISFGKVEKQESHQGFIGFFTDNREIELRNIQIKELQSEEPAWTPLFNGKGITGWNTTLPDAWKVTDGILTGTDGVLRSDKQYANFEMRAKVRLKFPGTADFCFRSDGTERGYAPLGNMWISECTGALAFMPKEGKSKVLVDYKNAVVSGDDWFNLEVRVVGQKAIVRINGKVTAEADIYEMAVSGFLEWRFDSQRSKLEVQKIEIKELPKPAPGFRPLFNGKDLTGWTSDVDRYFVKKDGSLHANPVPNEQKMLRTIKTYENYELRMKCKVEGELEAGNKTRGGIALHVTETPGTQSRSYGVVIRLISGRYPDIKVSGLGDVGEVKSAQKTKGPAGGARSWNDLRVVCKDGTITVYYNDEERWSCERCQVSKGQIGLWSEDGESYFRDIEIRKLPSPEPKFRPLFNGKNLDGWKLEKGQWLVKDGAIIADGGGNLVSDRAVSGNFRLRMEVNLKRGTGVIRFRTPPGDGDGWHLALMDNRKGSVDVNLVSNPRKPGQIVRDVPKMLDEWATLEIEAKEQEAIVRINGKIVATWHDDTYKAAAGRIGVWMAHVADPEAMEMHVRKIEVMELPSQSPKAEWTPLFNGKDMTGWQKLPGGKGGWTVNDQVLVGKGQKAYLRMDKAPATDFHLRMEAKHVSGEGALIVREQSPDVVGAGYEVILANTFKGNFNTGTVVTKVDKTGVSGFELQPQQLTKPGEWFTLEVIVNGNQVRTFINGKQVVNFVDVHKDYSKGLIGLRVGTQDDEGEVHVRKIEIKNLPPEEAGWEQLANGKDIRGWHGDFNLWVVENGDLVRNKNTIAARDGWDMKRPPHAGDFELKFQAKNESDGNLVGVLFRGEAGVVLSPAKALGAFTPNFRTLEKNLKAAKDADALKKALRADFNDYYIKCQDKRVTVRVNGVTTIDETFPELPDEGLLTLRVQNAESAMAAPAGKVYFRDMQLRPLPPLRPWIPLFNGKDLTGLTNLKKNLEAWKVEKGILVGRGDEAFVRTERGPFNDFHLRMEAKYVGGTAGLILREHSPDTPGGGYECMMEDHKDGDVNTGSIAVMTTKNIMGQLMVPAKVLTKNDEWFTLEVIANGNNLQTFVNGQRAVDFVDINKEFMEGFIGLNVRGKEGELHVKKIEIKELPPEQRGWIHVFNGVDLNGWNPSPRDKWTVENAALVGVARGAFTSLPTYQDFQCRIKAKFNADANGSFEFGNKAGVHAAVHIGDKAAMKTGSLSFHSKAPKNEEPVAWGKQLVQPDTWFDLEVTVRAKKFTVKVNGTTTAEKTVEKFPVMPLPIAFHANTPGTVITVSKVEIKELPPANEGVFKPLWNGKDLAGWKTISTIANDEIKNDIKVQNEQMVLNGRTLDARDYRAIVSNESFGDFEMKFKAKFAAAQIDGAVGLRLRTSIQNTQPGALSEGVYCQFTPKSKLWRVLFDGGKPGQFGLIEPDPDAIRWDDFNDFYIRYVGKTLVVRINGKTVVDAAIDHRLNYALVNYAPILDGQVGYAVHCGGTQLSLRDVEIKSLPRDRNWRPLFPGQDLEGWDGDKRAFLLKKDGTLFCQRIGKTDVPVLGCKENYKDFEISFNAKFGNNVNYLACTLRGKADITRDKADAIGIELRVGNGRDGALYQRSPTGTKLLQPLPAKTKALAADELHAYRIRCVGKRITIRIDNAVVLDDDIRWDTDNGSIIWSLHGALPEHGFEEIQLGDIAIKELSAAPVDPPFVPLFNGKDLTGRHAYTWIAGADAKSAWESSYQNARELHLKTRMALAS